MNNNKTKSQTPVLNKKQQKLTLSAKKQNKVTIKNVLANPFVNFWPLLKLEDNRIITEMLEKYLPRIRNDKVNVPWKAIKGVPKQERKTFRKNYAEGNRTDLDGEGHAVILGVNQVTTALEENCSASVLIASDVQPRFMVKHIIDLCVLHNVPVIVVADLRTTLQKCCSVSSAVLAIKKTIKEDMKLFQLHEHIRTISENYPVPKNHVNFKRRMEKLVSEEKLVNKDDSINERLSKDTVVKDKICIERVDKEEEKGNSGKDEEEKGNRGKDEEEKDEEEIIKQVYLIRKSNGDDVFVPKHSDCGNTSSANRMDVETSFISFVNRDEKPLAAPHPHIQHNDTVNYKSLVVRRLKGDSNRNKRKIDKLKQK